MRTETETLVAPPCAAAAAASAAAEGSGAVIVATVEVSGAPGVSACAGCAKPSEAAMTATPTLATRLRDLLKEIAGAPVVDVDSMTEIPNV